MNILRPLSPHLPSLLRFFLGSSPLFVTLFITRSTGSEKIAMSTTPGNLLLFSIIICGLLFFFRLFVLKKKIRRGSPLYTIVYLSILFLMSIFLFYLRIHIVSATCLFLGGIIFSVSGNEFMAYSGQASSSSWTEDSFEVRVLLEPFFETEVEGTSANSSVPREARYEGGPSPQANAFQNVSLESSLKNRILRLECENSIFLLDKEGGQYWSDIKIELDQASSRAEYNRLLDFESRDLQIRELKHQCLSLFQDILSQQPALGENTHYSTQEALCDFFEDYRDKLEEDPLLKCKSLEKDQRELCFLDQVKKDFMRRGPNSIYISKILF